MVASPAAAQLEKALELQRQGHAQEALVLLERDLPSLRDAGDPARLAQALSAAGAASLATGKYPAALQYNKEALALHQKLGDAAAQARDWNFLGLADMYLANYSPSLDEYRHALALDRANRDRDGEIERLNNLGNVYYFQGRYLDALHSFESALEKVNAATGEKWYSRRHQITIANLATVYQRLGAEEKALALYSQLSNGSAVRPSEKAQMLLNQGVLYRRLGDPVKALDMYRAAQDLFAKDQHRDAEIGAWRNIGIVRGLDLQDVPGALQAFSAALKLARDAGNGRAEVQAELYSGEILRRMHRSKEAGESLARATAGAQRTGLVEEHWKALYSTGLLADTQGDPARAERCFTDALRLVESVRSGLQLASLKTDFLADKRDVYDALIELRLKLDQATPADLFQLIEHSRARTFQDRLATGKEPLSLAGVQSKLDGATLLLEYWTGNNAAAVLWVKTGSAGVVRKQFTPEQATSVGAFTNALSQESDAWRSQAATIGQILLAGLPLDDQVRHLILIPDGVLQTVPYETLQIPGAATLLIERYDVSYLPTAAMVGRAHAATSRWRFPWQRQLLAIGDPIAGSSTIQRDPIVLGDQWQRLPRAAEEIQSIARILDGRTEQHLGPDARKMYLSASPLLHLSTHAAADMQDPERSRILLAAADQTEEFDYLFLREIYGMNLKNVDLVTVSACDTERGKLVRGEGAQGFSRAFLAAGASASVTSLWRVVDSSAAEFMKQFYFGLSRGRSKAEALRSAKLAFLRSGSKLAHPKYWAPFVLSGDGQFPIAPVTPWSAIIGLAAVLILSAALWIYRSARTRACRIHTHVNTS